MPRKILNGSIELSFGPQGIAIEIEDGESTATFRAFIAEENAYALFSRNGKVACEVDWDENIDDRIGKKPDRPNNGGGNNGNARIR